MSYVQGFLIPVPIKSKDAYRDLAAQSAPIFQEYGATRIVETWSETTPDGKVTDFKRAVKATPDEAVVFSWIEWPDKDTCDAAAKRMESDPRWKDMAQMPFDGKRMIWAGFDPIFEAET
ncbi:DUF1428 domain-containing protein [Aliiroseovarius sp. F47248L]|uniref:DUF1428 domain-containing protein n=1 Tax=Aliiroseovarius sp. F47248L TaxID=2926420 RepID=UPI001FF15F43|nr:DUF1428 domain-containing protein [Aliiroseovarius sp. F47248L]MCK0139688.1 DUF1428 domain-containing protein [Aliiroseovarius sp. F47248L]